MITGDIYKLEIRQKTPGKPIVIAVWYSGNNTLGSLLNPWRVYVACKDNLGNKLMAKDAVIRSASLDDSFDRTLWVMPNRTITLEVRLYAHEDTSKVWSWTWLK